MNSTNMEVRCLLNVFASKIESCNKPLDAQAVGNALYGLQIMNSDNLEVQYLHQKYNRALSRLKLK